MSPCVREPQKRDHPLPGPGGPVSNLSSAWRGWGIDGAAAATLALLPNLISPYPVAPQRFGTSILGNRLPKMDFPGFRQAPRQVRGLTSRPNQAGLPLRRFRCRLRLIWIGTASNGWSIIVTVSRPISLPTSRPGALFNEVSDPFPLPLARRSLHGGCSHSRHAPNRPAI